MKQRLANLCALIREVMLGSNEDGGADAGHITYKLMA